MSYHVEVRCSGTASASILLLLALKPILGGCRYLASDSQEPATLACQRVEGKRLRSQLVTGKKTYGLPRGLCYRLMTPLLPAPRHLLPASLYACNHVNHVPPVCYVPVQVVVEPLVVPAVTQPLLRVNCFECMWSSYSWGGGGLAGPFATAGAGGVDVMSGAKGVTLWRPKPPLGYVITGDVLTAGANGATLLE